MVEWEGVILEISIRKSPGSDRSHGFIIKISMEKTCKMSHALSEDEEFAYQIDRATGQ